MHREQANAKLTLSLRVVGRRHDGYHLIDAEMVTVDLADTLTFSEGEGLAVTREGQGGEVPTDGSNLIERALVAVGRRARVHLVKRLPAGAGLGGGSADAAAVLRWADCRDLDVAAALGADVPFCVLGGRARVTGVGEVVAPLDHRDATFTLLCPPVPVPTALVYEAWDRLEGPEGDNGNDLEPAALTVAPQLARWRDELGAATGRRPRLAGSGGTWFVEGAFPGGGRIVTRAVPGYERGGATCPPGAASGLL